MTPTPARMNPTLVNLLRLSNAATSAVVEHKQSRLNSELSESGRLPRTYNKAEAVAALRPSNPRFKVSREKVTDKNITDLCEELDIDCGSGNSFIIDIDDVKEISEHLGLTKNSRENATTKIIAMSQQKGGGGKTTLTVTVATGLAAECLHKYKVLVIDLDPQGTSTMYLKPNFTKNHFSVGDLLRGNYKLGANDTYAELCRSSCYSTSMPNLDIMCAREQDRQYEQQVRGKITEADANGTEYQPFKDLEHIIDAVKDDYDIILIDTTPYFSIANYAAHYAANGLLIPLVPAANDIDSSEKYLTHLAGIYEVLQDVGHEGYTNVTIIPSAVEKSKVHGRLFKRICETYSDWLPPIKEGEDQSKYSLIKSDAILNCAEEYRTIFDVSRSEVKHSQLGTKTAFSRAQEHTLSLIHHVEDICIEHWDAQNNNMFNKFRNAK